MNTKKIMAAALSVLVIGGTMPVVQLTAPMMTSFADEIDSGTCGENLTWTLDSEGTLTISGIGEMSFTEQPPWFK